MPGMVTTWWSPQINALLGSLVVAAGAWLAAAPAEGQRTSPVRIGALTESWGPTTLLVGLRDGLQELGYREDRDFSIGVRFTQGDPAELPAAARDLVRLGVDLIVASDSTNAIKAARMATDRIPIVFVGGSEVVESGVVKSFAHPGGNITGVADIDVELVPKRMELFREMVPGLKRVLFAYDAANPLADALLRAHRDAARRLGLVLVERPVRSQAEAQAAFALIADDEGAEPGLVDRNASGPQLRDLALVRVDAHDRIAHLGEAGACHQADVAAADHSDIQFPLSSRARRDIVAQALGACARGATA